jgi:hypothetical protein
MVTVTALKSSAKLLREKCRLAAHGGRCAMRDAAPTAD